MSAWTCPAALVTLSTVRARRLWYVGDAFRAGMSVQKVFDLTRIDPWFLEQIEEIIQTAIDSMQKIHEQLGL